MNKVALLMAAFFIVLLTLSPVKAQDDKHKFQEFTGDPTKDYPRTSVSASAGYNATGGYIETNALVGGFNITHDRQWTGHIFKSGIKWGTVTYPDGDPITNVNNYYGNYKIEAYVYKNRKPYFWSLVGAESDEFQGFWGRYAAEAGFGYSYFGASKYVLKNEIGYAFVDTNWINRVELENGEFHYWEPTHNGLLRLIASIPIADYVKFVEEAKYRHNVQDEDDYLVESSTGLSFKLFSKVSFQSTFDISYTNQPGLVDELDETGAVVVIDDGDPATDPLTSVVPTERTAYGWTNALVVTFF